MKTALITGATSQDCAYLAKFLLEKGYQVFATYRRLSTPNFWRLQSLGILDRVKLIPMELIDMSSMLDAIRTSNPDELYHLAAQSFVEVSFQQPIGTGEITGLGVTRILAAIKEVNPKIKFYQASSSELFNGKQREKQNEETPFEPWSPYGAAKCYGHHITKIYREAYGIFACNGIAFNHESALRSLEFVTRKISNAVARIKLGLQDNLELGNLEAKRDWGYAPDYVEAMWLMLQQEKPDDYVIATGETHTVREFAARAFAVAGLDWREYVKINNSLLRPLDVPFLCGDYSKAKRELGWGPKVKFNQLVELMVAEDLSRWQRCLKGEHFAWDAFTGGYDETGIQNIKA